MINTNSVISDSHNNVTRSASDLVRDLSSYAEEIISSLLPEKQPVALVDYPTHGNVGDSAIWLGEKALLKRLGIPVLYETGIRNYSARDLKSKIKNGTILITGGGNTGDLWPKHEGFRQEIISTFKNNRIIQLPQSIYYEKRENLLKAKAVYNAHPNLTFLLRDQPSLEFAQNEFKCKSLFCPDMAFALGPQKRIGQPVTDILILKRTDHEALKELSIPKEESVEISDWITPEETFVRRMREFLTTTKRNHPEKLRGLAKFIAMTYTPQANENFRRGIKLLSRARFVISDRLHVHIFCLLLNIPHVCLDNSYRKVRNLYEAWTQDSPITFWAEDFREALEKAKSWIAEERSAA